MLFSTFAAEALVPVALFYGILWLVMRPSAGAAHWGAHLLLVGGMCLAIAVLRYTSAFVFGGDFALNATLVWAFIAPAALAWAVAYWHAPRLIGAVDPVSSPEPAPPVQPAQPPTAAVQQEPPSAPQRLVAAMPAVAEPRVAAPAPVPAPAPASEPAAVHVAPAEVARTAPGGGWDIRDQSTGAIILGILGVAVAAAVLLSVLLLFLFRASDPGQSPERVPAVGIAEHEAMRERGPARDADPAWIAAVQNWERRHREWLTIPGAREALDRAIVDVDAEGTTSSYAELMEVAGGRAHRVIYAQQRAGRSEPTQQCPPGLIPDPSFNNQCNLPEAVEANKRARGG